MQRLYAAAPGASTQETQSSPAEKDRGARVPTGPWTGNARRCRGFFITGRKKNVIVLKNGKNIYPEELETLVGKLPYVDECMVFGYPKDDDLVISVKIVYNKDYVKDNFSGLTQEQLKEKIWEDIKEINSGLTNYKHMKKLIITDEPMIKTSTAKIKRHEEMSKILAEEGAIK